jgi:Ca2+-binding RTX toxin-like protein
MGGDDRLNGKGGFDKCSGGGGRDSLRNCEKGGG